MIGALLILTGLVMVSIPGLCRMPTRLPAREWTRVVAGALIAGFLAVELGLASIALPTLLRSLNTAGVASACDRMLATYRPMGDAGGWIAALLMVLIASRGVLAGFRAHRRARALVAEPWLGSHEDCGDYELVVLPTAEVHAASVPSRPPQIQISEGLIRLLEPNEVDAVVRHEATHQRYRHWRYRALGISVERGLWPFPFARWSGAALDMATEAWADEAATNNDSPQPETSVRKAILLVSGATDAYRRDATSSVERRAKRLGNPRPDGSIAIRFAVHGPLLVLGMVAAMLSASWVVGVHHAWALPGYCS